MQMDDRNFFNLVLQHTAAFEKRFFDFLDIQHIAPLLTHCPHTCIAHGAEKDQLYLVEVSVTSAVQMKLAGFLEGFSLTQESSKI